MTRLILIPIFIQFSFYGVAQDQTNVITLSGTIIDQSTLEPVPAAHIYSGPRGTYADLKGRFSLRLDRSDTITCSHVSYYNQSIVIDTVSQYDFIIYLQKEVRVLNPFTLGRLPDISLFKQQILDTDFADVKLRNAMRNMSLIRLSFLNGYVPEMTSADNHRNYLIGPQGFTILSNSPNKGLSKALREKNRGGVFADTGSRTYNYERHSPFSGGRDSSKLLKVDSI